MAITPAYIPAPGQSDAQALARAQALGIGIAPRAVPPVYAAAVTVLPGVIAEGGGVVYLPDDGSLTATQVSTAVAPLVAAQTAAATLAANNATITANVLTRQTQIQAWIAANPSGAVLTAGQTLTLAQMLNGLCKLLLQQFSSTTGS